MPSLPCLRKSPTVLHIGALVVLAGGVRLLGIYRPLVGNFATKNCVYAMIARNWAEGRASLWYPTLDLLMGGHRSLHMLEFPLSAYLAAGLWQAFGGSLDVWGRAVSVASSAAAVGVLFLLVRRHLGTRVAMGASLALCLSPVSIIYGQSFMLEASLLFFTVAVFDAWDRWLGAGRPGWLILASFCLALLLLTKIYMLVVLLPLGAMWLGAKGPGARGQGPGARGEGRGEKGEGRRVKGEGRRERGEAAATPCRCSGATWAGNFQFSIFNFQFAISPFLALALAILPAALWYAHAMHTAAPDGPLAGQVYYSVRQSAEVHFPPHPLLYTSGFYVQVLRDLAGVVLTPLGFGLALVGLWDRRWRQQAFWLVAAAALIVALPRKFYEMNYYYLAILPPLCILIGLGWNVVAERFQPGRKAVALILVAAVALSMRYAARPAFVTPAEDRGVVAAADAVRARTAEDEPIVTVHGSTIDLLYYCHRPGWAVAPGSPNLAGMLREYARQGARYIVVVGATPPGLWPPVAQGDDFAVYRLAD